MEVYVDSIKICQRNNDHTTTIILQKNKREREKERERERERERKREREREKERERTYSISIRQSTIPHTSLTIDADANQPPPTFALSARTYE